MSTENKIIVSCPTCKKKVIWNEQPYRPFCSERCKLIDLGEWATGEKSIPGESIDAEPDNDSFLH